MMASDADQEVIDADACPPPPGFYRGKRVNELEINEISVALIVALPLATGYLPVDSCGCN